MSVQQVSRALVKPMSYTSTHNAIYTNFHSLFLFFSHLQTLQNIYLIRFSTYKTKFSYIFLKESSWKAQYISQTLLSVFIFKEVCKATLSTFLWVTVVPLHSTSTCTTACQNKFVLQLRWNIALTHPLATLIPSNIKDRANLLYLKKPTTTPRHSLRMSGGSLHYYQSNSTQLWFTKPNMPLNLPFCGNCWPAIPSLSTDVQVHT